MSRISSVTGAGFLKGDDSKDIERFAANVGRFLEELQPLINGKIEFDINLATETVTTFFKFANTTQMVSHSLARTGLKYLICDKSAACDVFHPSSQDTKTAIAFQSTVAGVTVSLVLF